MRSIIVLVLLLVAPGLARAQDSARMDQVVQSFVSRGTFTGGVLVARGADVVFSKAYGLADVEKNLANTTATRFRVASITKQFRVLPQSDTLFFMRDLDIQIEFVRDASGAATEFISHQGGRQERARRTR